MLDYSNILKLVCAFTSLSFYCVSWFLFLFFCKIQTLIHSIGRLIGSTTTWKLLEMKQLFKCRQLVWATQPRNLAFCPLKKNKGCWHKRYVNLHFPIIWTWNMAIFACESRGVINFEMLILMNLILFHCLLMLF